eukprot:CAMPEP_0177598624 /NCGR_PEP_ID=MMETSP0419_2-20121207/12475_1 /TAXON_ID=582737 /ORGANISM="Tetraselmis sp., Strain GSL018" /LENGTH=310 /DNA_ID=CAMNT_0019091135 /DNA_START=152 /DNA_END=1084 /DNA_ORIENTATION=+
MTSFGGRLVPAGSGCRARTGQTGSSKIFTPVPARTRGFHSARRTGSVSVTAMFQTGTGNPALQHGRFEDTEYSAPIRRDPDPATDMTVNGAVDRTTILLMLTSGAAAWSWHQVFAGVMAKSALMSLTTATGIIGLIIAFATTFKPDWSPFTAPAYAVCKGLALGGISAVLEVAYPGIVVQALCATFGTLFALLAAFKAKIIRVNEGFRSVVSIATGGFFIGIMAMTLLRMFGVAIPGIASGPLGIGIAVVSVGLAASNLLIDFDTIQMTALQGAPKWMEWYCGFSLLVTLVWMYTSILRLLQALAGGEEE